MATVYDHIKRLSVLEQARLKAAFITFMKKTAWALKSVSMPFHSKIKEQLEATIEEFRKFRTEDLSDVSISRKDTWLSIQTPKYEFHLSKFENAEGKKYNVISFGDVCMLERTGKFSISIGHETIRLNEGLRTAGEVASSIGVTAKLEDVLEQVKEKVHPAMFKLFCSQCPSDYNISRGENYSVRIDCTVEFINKEEKRFVKNSASNIPMCTLNLFV